MSKRPCQGPMAVVDAGLLAHIVHYLALPKGVLSLLQALPRHALDTPLAALRTLLPTAALDDVNWPQVCIENIDRRYTSSVLTALPAFRSISILSVIRLDRVLRAASPSASTDATLDAAVAFAATWGHKIKTLDVLDWPDGTDDGVLARFLGLCIGLNNIRVRVKPSDPSFPAAFTRVVAYVTRLDLIGMGEDAFLHESWLPVLQAWLASGRAQHLSLGLSFFHSADNVRLVRCIAGTTSLTSLEIEDDGVLQALVDVAPPLLHITELRVGYEEPVDLEALATNCISLSTLRVLRLTADNRPDWSYVLALLPCLLALRELSFAGCDLEYVRQLDAMPAPRHLEVLQLANVDMDDDTCLALLYWASQSPRLQTVVFDTLQTVHTSPLQFGRYVRQWIANGVRGVTLYDCGIQETSAVAIGMALSDTRRASPFVLRLENDDEMTFESYKVLLDALATSLGVTLEVNERRPNMREAIADEALSLELHVSDDGGERLTIHNVDQRVASS